MGWQSHSYLSDVWLPSRRPLMESFKISERCFIRKQHECGKVFGASKSCFIACPNQDDLEPILELMSEKLSRAGIEPFIAVKDRAYGQDIFCTKICGKIIESRFCIVILDDAIAKEMNIPNPNVYYEYGLMTALRKHIIPLQKDGLKLAFNIQSYDTVKYSPRNIGGELDRAIKDGIKLTESQEKEEEHPLLTDKVIMRRLEMAGFVSKDTKWFLHEAIGDTSFRGFGQDAKSFYLYLGRIDDEKDTQSYMEDLGIVLYRTEKKRRELTESREDYGRKIDASKAQDGAQSYMIGAVTIGWPGSPTEYRDRSLREYERQVADIDARLSQMSKIVVGFIVMPDIDTENIAKQAKEIIGGNPQYEVAVGTKDEIVMGGATIRFSASTH
jgi:hypothetical protein